MRDHGGCDGPRGRPAVERLVTFSPVCIGTLLSHLTTVTPSKTGRAVGMSLLVLALTSAPGCATTAAGSAPHRRPTVVLFGDSLSVQAGPYFDRMVESETHARVTDHVYGGTALCDWLPTMRKVASTHPDVAVLEFIGNTFTPCMEGCPYGSQSAVERYCSDMDLALGYFLPAKIHVFLVGTPITYEEWVSKDKDWDNLNKAFSELAAEHPKLVTFVNAGAAVEGPRRSFTWTLPCLKHEPCTGPVVNGVRSNVVRAPDGIHFCPWSEQGCSTYSSGAFRFGSAMAAPVIKVLEHWSCNSCRL